MGIYVALELSLCLVENISILLIKLLNTEEPSNEIILFYFNYITSKSQIFGRCEPVRLRKEELIN